MLSQFAGYFLPNSGGVAGCVDWIWQEIDREVGRHIAAAIFKHTLRQSKRPLQDLRFTITIAWENYKHLRVSRF